MCVVGVHRLLRLLIKHMVAEQPGSSMLKNSKGMKFNPNRDAHQEFIRKDGRKELLYYVNLIRAC